MSQASMILVTGAAGRIGRAAVRGLTERGFRVRAFDLVRAGGTDDVVVGSIADPEAVRRAVDGIDVLIHLAATPDDDDFLERLLPNNVIGVYHVLEAAQPPGCARWCWPAAVKWSGGSDSPARCPSPPLRRPARAAGTPPPSCFRKLRGERSWGNAGSR